MDKAMYRESAGVITSFIIVVSYVMIGFVVMGASLYSGDLPVAPGDWSSAMLSLASAALGYLIGKQSSQGGGDKVDIPLPPGTTISQAED